MQVEKKPHPVFFSQRNWFALDTTSYTIKLEVERSHVRYLMILQLRIKKCKKSLLLFFYKESENISSTEPGLGMYGIWKMNPDKSELLLYITSMFHIDRTGIDYLSPLCSRNFLLNSLHYDTERKSEYLRTICVSFISRTTNIRRH